MCELTFDDRLGMMESGRYKVHQHVELFGNPVVEQSITKHRQREIWGPGDRREGRAAFDVDLKKTCTNADFVVLCLQKCDLECKDRQSHSKKMSQKERQHFLQHKAPVVFFAHNFD